MMRGRRTTAGISLAVTLAFVAASSGPPARAQFLRGRSATAAAKTSTKPAAEAPKPAADEPVPKLEITGHATSPTEPIALINNEPITRQQLADECVAQKGPEILETLIARKLVEQAIRKNKIEVTPAEVDAEIERIAMQLAGVSREAWLATLSKERKISPARYARDVIYPSLALRKLAKPLVQVTEKDVKDAYEAQFGERVKCRMIMLNDMSISKQVWEDVKKNPALFEKIAQDKSIDTVTRAVGGMLPDPIARHANPRELSDRIFAQLVDVDPSVNAKDVNIEKYRPKDGDISGIIQITEVTWAIFQRVGMIPARPYNDKDPDVQKQVKDSLFEAKLQYEINKVLSDLMLDSAIENRLTGQVKMSKQEEAATAASAAADGQVQPAAAQAPTPTLPPTPSPARALPAGTVPVGVAPADAKKAEALRK